MTNAKLASCLVALMVGSGVPAALAAPQEPSKPDPTAVSRGGMLYGRYCAACHGASARGNGPLAADLSVPVPDLTAIAARNGGKFPADRVQKIITSGETLRGHGSADMPAWGDVFRRTDGLDGATPEEAIRSLTHYLWSLQPHPGK